ncbi:hypothetical protein D1P53_005106 [Cryptococcus gattii VGV]|nr:hypothetical protein D1P53_005106 [Cryptococcus gattii VGV]
MAVYTNQLQPWEENQSPSPTEVAENPYEQAFAPLRTSSLQVCPPGPPSPVNTLHSRLSGDPDSPPPAWKRRSSADRRPSISSEHQRQLSASSTNNSLRSVGDHTSPQNISARAARSPVESVRSAQSISPTPSSRTVPLSRRHPNLAMTIATARPPATTIPSMVSHESSDGLSLSLGNGLALPNPAFRRRAGEGANSARSSIVSTQDLNSLTSEELWTLGQEEVPDMSNPMRTAAERPLDTVRRLSTIADTDIVYHPGLPSEVIWPSAPPSEEFLYQPPRNKSFTSIQSSPKRLSLRRSYRRTSAADISTPTLTKDKIKPGARSMPVSPVAPRKINMLSSAHSSSTSLSSHQAIPPNKSFPALGSPKLGPPASLYSKDFISSLAPREGGYAVAATIGGIASPAGSVLSSDKRRSSYADSAVSRTRAPLARSAGMGRWSLDGGENYGKPYLTSSAATTSSNLTAPPLTSNQADVYPSEPRGQARSQVPEGALPPAINLHGASAQSSPVSGAMQKSSPNPSPLSQQTHAQDITSNEAGDTAEGSNVSEATSDKCPVETAVSAPIKLSTSKTSIPTDSIAAESATPPPINEKSKKKLAKDTKAQRKAEAQAVARAKAEQMRQDLAKKQQQREEEQRRKIETKQKEKEEKARRKAEKKEKKNGFLRKPASPALTKAEIESAVASSQAEAPANKIEVSTTTSKPAPAIISSSTSLPAMQSVLSVNNLSTVRPEASESDQTSASPMPAGQSLSSSKTGEKQGENDKRPEVKLKRSFFGTLKKRFSYYAVDKEGVSPVSSQRARRSTTVAGPTGIREQEAGKTGHEKQEANGLFKRRLEKDGLVAPPPRQMSLIAVASDSSIHRRDDTVTEETSEITADESPRTVRPNSTLISSPSESSSSSRHQIPRKPISTEETFSNKLLNQSSLSEARNPSPIEGDISSEHTRADDQISDVLSPSAATIDDFGTNVESSSPAPMPVTPSTSGDSQLSYIHSHASHNSNITPVTSVSESEALSDEGLRMGKESKELQQSGGEIPPEREGSDETVLAIKMDPTSSAIIAV